MNDSTLYDDYILIWNFQPLSISFELLSNSSIYIYKTILLILHLIVMELELLIRV